MNYHVLTLFPEMIEQGLGTSILGRAQKSGRITLDAVNIRDYSEDKHMRVDDYPYGGGAGMVMQAEPVYRAYQAVEQKIGHKPRVIYLTPQGRLFDQTMVEELAMEEDLVFLCGHYEGIDERVLEEVVTDYVSIGDYVLTGGELAAMVMIDAISRFVPGVLGSEESAQFESLQDNLLEYPHYSRPEIWRGRAVPEVLLSGDHKKIEAWRREQSVARTKERRPDLMEKQYTVTAAYFSPTEGTKRAAEMLAGELSQTPKYIELTRRRIRRQHVKFGSHDLLIAAAPVYGGQLPGVEGLFENLHGENTLCIVMAAYGNRHYDDTLAQMAKILTQQGFICIGGIAPIIPHIYSDKLGTGRPDGEDAKIFRQFALKIRRRLEDHDFTPAELPGNPSPEPKPMKGAPKFWDGTKCTHCQTCALKCPVGAIDADTMQIREDLCIHCMRCAKVCPAEARSYDASQVKAYLEGNYMARREVECFL